MSLSEQKVVVVGGGSVGSTLANAIAKSKKAASVAIAARDVDKTKAKLAENGFESLTVEPITEAIASADILLLAVPGANSDEGIQEIAKSLGNVSGKIIIDATNPCTAYPGLEVRWSQGTSGAEVLQKALPDAMVYKAFNTLGVEHMADAEGKDMMFCGPDDKIKEVVQAVGFKPYYMGPIRYARNLEAIAELWIHCALPPLPGQNMGRGWTFSIQGPVE